MDAEQELQVATCFDAHGKTAPLILALNARLMMLLIWMSGQELPKYN